MYTSKVNDQFGPSQLVQATNMVAVWILSKVYYVYQHLRITTLRTGIINLLKRHIKKLLPISRNIVARARTLEQKDALSRYEELQDLIRKYRKLVAMLEGVHFFHDEVFEKACDRVLYNFYKASAIARNKAFSDTETNPEDRELAIFAAQVSVNSL